MDSVAGVNREREGCTKPSFCLQRTVMTHHHSHVTACAAIAIAIAICPQLLGRLLQLAEGLPLAPGLLTRHNVAGQLELLLAAEAAGLGLGRGG